MGRSGAVPSAVAFTATPSGARGTARATHDGPHPTWSGGFWAPCRRRWRSPQHLLPSDFPTELPSGFPTALPSDFPSGLPTALPSGLESLLPGLEGVDTR
ncbi:hypothetical protein E7X38_01615 [Streptomyces sp. Akac8]|nr:hypothetical protein E7X38_01615 [Streptomyces sp. Akac8]